MVRSRKKDRTQLTDVELEMMTIIWSLGPCSVHQIMEALPKERPLAYTSVSTIVRILEQKKFVASQKDGRGHLYQSVVTKEDYEAVSLSHLVKKVFQGEPSQLVSRLLSSGDLDQDDIAKIQELIAQRSKA